MSLASIIDLLSTATIKWRGDDNTDPRNVYADAEIATASSPGVVQLQGDVGGTGFLIRVLGLLGFPIRGKPKLDGDTLCYNATEADQSIGLFGWLEWRQPPSAGGAGTAVLFIDDEIPTGAVDGSNAAFTLSHEPNPVGCLALFLNGVLQRYGIDYTLSGATITYSVAPAFGDNHLAYYRASDQAIAYGEDETPSGTVDGSNDIFGLANTPSPAISLRLYVNGVLQRYGTDYTLSGSAVTFAVAPASGDNLRAWYRYTGPVSDTQFIDNQTPSGAINGSNTSFALTNTPLPAASMNLSLNGDLLRRGTDYTLSGNVITMSVAPSTGDNLIAFYRAAPIVVSFADNVIPTGTIDGVNVTFALPQTPNPSSSLKLSLNGNRLRPTTDYSLSGATITYVNPPSSGDNHYADYRY